MMVFQIKERIAPTSLSKQPETKSEINWFKKEVLGKARKQIKQTLENLKMYEIILENNRGHRFTLPKITEHQYIHKIILYAPNESLPDNFFNQKFVKSSSLDINIHLISKNDYTYMVRFFMTLTEIANYLIFREKLFQRWGADINNVEELAIMGQYLSLENSNTSIETKPNNDFIKNFYERRVNTNFESTDYYYILSILTKLKRREYSAFEMSLKSSVEAVKLDVDTDSIIMRITRLDCCFVFIPCTKEKEKDYQNYLNNYTTAHKYDKKCSICIGLIIIAEEADMLFFEWCYLSSPWNKDPILEKELKNEPLPYYLSYEV